MTSFIEKYYDEFGKQCPFKLTKMGIDEKELITQFEPRLKEDVRLLEKFFQATVGELLKETHFTSTEIERLVYLDHYWDLPKINFIHTNQYKLTKYNIFSHAVRNGNLHVMKWLKTCNCPWDSNTITYAIDYAIKNNDLTNLKWVRENGYDEYILNYHKEREYLINSCMPRKKSRRRSKKRSGRIFYTKKKSRKRSRRRSRRRK